MNELKLTFNQKIDLQIAAVRELKQEQIEACAYVMGASGAGWNKENIIAELESEKYDISANEVESEVADGPRSVILEQVRNGVAVRMALLYLVLGGEKNSDG